MSELSAGRRFAYGALTVALSLVIVFGLLEVALRVYAAVTPNVDVEFSRYAQSMKQRTDSGVRFLHSPSERNTFFGVEVATNSRGFRDEELPAERAADEIRIGLLGDSVTFGWGVPYGERFSERLERSWTEAEGRPVRLINTGHGNYNTVQQLAMLDEHLAADDLDALLQVWYINDAEPTPEHREAPWYARFHVAIFLWSKTDLLSRRAGNRGSYVDYYRDLYHEDAAGYVAFVAALEETGRIARERGLPWWFVVLPEFHGFEADGPFEPVYAQVARAAEAAGARVVDAVPAFRGEDPAAIRVAVNDVHPNSYGHERIAAAIAAAELPLTRRGE